MKIYNPNAGGSGGAVDSGTDSNMSGVVYGDGSALASDPSIVPNGSGVLAIGDSENDGVLTVADHDGVTITLDGATGTVTATEFVGLVTVDSGTASGMTGVVYGTGTALASDASITTSSGTLTAVNLASGNGITAVTNVNVGQTASDGIIRVIDAANATVITLDGATSTVTTGIVKSASSTFVLSADGSLVLGDDVSVPGLVTVHDGTGTSNTPITLDGATSAITAVGVTANNIVSANGAVSLTSDGHLSLGDDTSIAGLITVHDGSNVGTNNITLDGTTGTVTATGFVGNGSMVTGVIAAELDSGAGSNMSGVVYGDATNIRCDSTITINGSGLLTAPTVSDGMGSTVTGGVVTANTFNGSGANLTGVLASNTVYTATTPADWLTAAPTTVQDAIDRMSACLAVLNAGPIP